MYIHVYFAGLGYTSLLLFLTVIFTVLAIQINKWRLDKKLAVALLIWYILFLIFGVLLELNFFGVKNLPQCEIDW